MGGDMSDNQPELLGDIIIRVMNTLNIRRHEMCDFFDDFDDFFDGDFMDDGFDDGMEDSMDHSSEDDLDHKDEQNDELSWDEAYWIGTGIGWAYEEGKWKRRKKKEFGTNESSDID
jgi:hypothetical protein